MFVIFFWSVFRNLKLFLPIDLFSAYLNGLRDLYHLLYQPNLFKPFVNSEKVDYLSIIR